MGFSRQEYWSGFPFPPLGNFPNRGIEPLSPALQADSLLMELPGKPQDPISVTFQVSGHQCPLGHCVSQNSGNSGNFPFSSAQLPE